MKRTGTWYFATVMSITFLVVANGSVLAGSTKDTVHRQGNNTVGKAPDQQTASRPRGEAMHRHSPTYITVSKRSPHEKPWQRVITGPQNQKIRLIGHTWDGTLVTRVTTTSILLRDVKDVRIEYSRIEGSQTDGIQLSSRGSTENVTIVNNVIRRTGRNGISAAQRHKKDVDHKNVRIINNKIFDTARVRTSKAAHGIYVQCQDVFIDGNLIDGVGDGNGISVRSSGIIRNNIVMNVSRPSSNGAHGIAYYSDHVAGGSKILVIDNNTIYADTLSGRGHALGLLRPSRHNPLGQAGEVHRFLISNNITVTSRRGGNGIHIHPYWHDVTANGNQSIIPGR